MDHPINFLLQNINSCNFFAYLRLFAVLIDDKTKEPVYNKRILAANEAICGLSTEQDCKKELGSGIKAAQCQEPDIKAHF